MMGVRSCVVIVINDSSQIAKEPFQALQRHHEAETEVDASHDPLELLVLCHRVARLLLDRFQNCSNHCNQNLRRRSLRFTSESSGKSCSLWPTANILDVPQSCQGHDLMKGNKMPISSGSCISLGQIFELGNTWNTMLLAWYSCSIHSEQHRQRTTHTHGLTFDALFGPSSTLSSPCWPQTEAEPRCTTGSPIVRGDQKSWNPICPHPSMSLPCWNHPSVVRSKLFSPIHDCNQASSSEDRSTANW